MTFLHHAVDAVLGRHDQRSDGRLSGAWDKPAHRPVLRMMVCVGCLLRHVDLRRSLMSIKSVNTHSATTPTGPSPHVHSGALGWSATSRSGAIYCMVPLLWKRKDLYSLRLVDWHFWLSTIGIVLYISAMWVSGINARADVARLYKPWLSRILLHRNRRGDASLLHSSRRQAVSCS